VIKPISQVTKMSDHLNPEWTHAMRKGIKRL
jgi:hypothetical protein